MLGRGQVSVARFAGGRWKSNSYLLVGNEGDSVVIDAGDGVRELVEHVRQHGISPLAILCTHGHYDHVESAMYAKEALDVPVILHFADLALFRAASLYRRLFEAKAPVQMPTIETTVGDTNSFISLGSLSVEVICTPGHTEGSVCYLVGDSLFSGDTLLPHSAGRTDLPGGDPTRMAASLGVLGTLPHAVRIYPGHGAPVSLGDAIETARTAQRP